MKKIILLCGESGSGKDTVAKILKDKYDLKQVISYTTRKPRYENEDTHIFITEKELDKYKNDMVGYTFYNNNYYFATNKQVEENDIYVIDLLGIQYFKQHYNGDKEVIVVYLQVDDNIRKERMKNRGDNIEQIQERLQYDENAFKNAIYITSNIFVNINSEDTADKIYKLFK